MDRKHGTFCSDLYANINKYNIEIEKYLLPVLEFPTKHVKPVELPEIETLKPTRLIETFKRKVVDLEPESCIYQFMSESDVELLQETKDRKTLIKIIDDKLKNFKIKGLPRKLTIELFLSVVQFGKSLEFERPQIGALLGIFYNTHLFFLLDLWITTEQLFKYFKKILFVHCIAVRVLSRHKYSFVTNEVFSQKLDPKKTLIFTGPAIKRLVFYFNTVYTRNLPLIRLLMLPHYGLTLRTPDNPIPEELLEAMAPKKKGKKEGKK